VEVAREAGFLKGEYVLAKPHPTFTHPAFSGRKMAKREKQFQNLKRCAKILGKLEPTFGGLSNTPARIGRETGELWVGESYNTPLINQHTHAEISESVGGALLLKSPRREKSRKTSLLKND